MWAFYLRRKYENSLVHEAYYVFTQGAEESPKMMVVMRDIGYIW
jgi:hypothetical protein